MSLSFKIKLVENYILAKKGVKVKIIFKNIVDNSLELEKLDLAYQYACRHFKVNY